jgi:hypothetical protein
MRGSCWIPFLDVVEENLYVTTVGTIIGFPTAIVGDVPMEIGVVEMVT